MCGISEWEKGIYTHSLLLSSMKAYSFHRHAHTHGMYRSDASPDSGSHVSSRLKSSTSIMNKLARKQLDFTLENVENNLYDVAGIRVVCSYVDYLRSKLLFLSALIH